ncbi:MAG: Gldg family protein, partial [Planctomycetota bacterium]
MKIRQIWTVFCRELSTYFNTVIGYVFIVAFLFLSVGLYMNTFFALNRLEIRSFFESMPLLLAVFLPAISMRLWSEDRRGNTLELLLTLPLSVTSIMLGKFLAALAFFSFALLGTLSVPILLYSLGEPDYGPILGAYLGTLLLASYYLALGTFLSGFFKDQIVAFVLTLICCIALWISSTDYFAFFLDGSWQSLHLGTFLKEYVGIRFQNLSKGLLPLGDLAYFVLFSTAFLYLNQLLIGHRRPIRPLAFSGISFLVLGTTLFGNACFTHLNLPKIDLTQSQIFTLSPSSKKILQSLEFPISLHFYINEKDSLPSDMRGLEQSVIDLLQELKQASLKENKYYLNYFVNHPRIPSKIPQGNEDALQKLQVQESETLSPEEIHRRHLEQEKLRYETERLQWKGITPFPKQTVEADTMEIRDVYSGIAISYLDELEEVVTPLQPGALDQLEYEIMNRIQKLMVPRPRILVYAPREEDTQKNQFLRSQGMAVPPPRDPFKGVIDYLSDFHQYQVARFDFDRPI